MKAKFENPQDHFLSLVTCYFLDVEDLVQHTQVITLFFYLCSKCHAVSVSKECFDLALMWAITGLF